MNKYFFLFFFITCWNTTHLSAQQTYNDSLRKYQENYIQTHDVVKGDDRKFLHFFPVSEKYRVTASVELVEIAPWFQMKTSGKEKQIYRVYVLIHFKLADTVVTLEVYQSQQLMHTTKYADALFIPFTDLTNGGESYDNGRYIDLTIDELKTGYYVMDFNKAYNPYCAYISNQYNCPIPPKANDLPVAIRAGEMRFGKDH